MSFGDNANGFFPFHNETEDPFSLRWQYHSHSRASSHIPPQQLHLHLSI